MAAEQLRELFTVIEGGAEVAIENVETFAPDVTIPGAAELLGKTETVTLGNGAAAEVSQLVTETSATTATTSGVGLLAMDVGTIGAAIAPALGILAGVGLYNLTPEFWDDVSETLLNAGCTIGGKVRCFLNSATGEVGVSNEVLEIFKEKFINAGLYQGTIEQARSEGQAYYDVTIDASDFNVSEFKSFLTAMYEWGVSHGYSVSSAFLSNIDFVLADVLSTIGRLVNLSVIIEFYKAPSGQYTLYIGDVGNTSGVYNFNNGIFSGFNGNPNVGFRGNQYIYHIEGRESYTTNMEVRGTLDSLWVQYGTTSSSTYIAQISGMWKSTPSPNVQPNAIYPASQTPIHITYPNWSPWQLPQELPTIFPIEVPVNNPSPGQQEAQNPNPNPEPSPFLDWLLQVLPQPEPNPNPQPEPVPEPDPDPQPVPEPLPVIDPAEILPDPIDPNKPIPPSPIPIIPDLPTTVDSNAMFTVYAPSISQLNAFGGWLWSNNIIDMLLRIWQNPLEGIIAFQKVYAVPTVGSSSNIIVGYVDSNVAAPVVTSQFVTVNCGTITVDEILHNATDYPPYTMMHIYLPFIGIVELDCNEFMNGSITVTYHIDVYTGTCLVEVASTRSPDMTTPTIIYTFSGNASQQLPLTSSNFGGALNALVSTVSGVARMGSGGALKKISGLSTIGHSVSHEMIHIAHSGDLSANAGIMALRTPYLIIGRRNSYDANAYNELYGYPANKTVYLGNCSGFTRVKAGFLRSKATEEEKQEIMDLLKKGVIL